MAQKYTILLTGGSGQVGQSLQELVWPDGVMLDCPDSRTLNLADKSCVADYLAVNSYSAIINCAAHTAVDKAESEAEQAMAINAEAPGLLSAYAAKYGIPMVHISTDYVFNGTKNGPYTEQDEPGPLGVYGHSKLAGEQAVLASGARAIILRTAWVLSAYGHNFLKTMMRLAAERDTISVVDDQHGNPTSALDIAKAVQTIILAMRDDPQKQGGIYHFVNEGETSWHGLAAYIFAAMEKRGDTVPVLNAITTDQYPTPAKRPANSRLATDQIIRDFAITPRSWQSAVNEILERIWEGAS